MAAENKDDATAKYDQLYQNELVSEQTAAEIRVQPLQFAGWPRERKEALVYLARPGGRLLEVGCGRGEVLATLAPHFQEAVGVELSPLRAERARRGLAHLANCRVVQTALEGLPEMERPPFDCIVWADVIEHIADVIGAMRILAGLCRPGSQLVTVTPNVAFLPQRLRMLLGRAPNTALPWYPNEGFAADPGQTILLDAGHLHYFTYRQVEILYQIAGFRPERRLGIGTRFSRLRNLWPTLLSGQVCLAGTFVGEN